MRVSTTTIESYRLWADGDWMPESELLATICGEFKPTPKMLLGQAFGRLLENPNKYIDDVGDYIVPIETSEGWKAYDFPGEVVEPCLKLFDPDGAFEVKAVKSYGNVDVVAKVDYLIGSVISENKVKTSQFEFDKYFDSYQWRFYLDIFQARVLRYNVFQLSEDGQELKDTNSFNLYPYPDLHMDCWIMLDRFTRYVRSRGLQEYLQEKVFAG